jgi:hypothetical protein
MRLRRSVFCDQCHADLDPRKVEVSMAYRPPTPNSFKKEVDFCSWDCFQLYFFDEAIQKEIDRKVRREFNWLHKQICPACVRRIT